MISSIDYIYIEITAAMKKRALRMAEERRINGRQAVHMGSDVEYIGALGEIAIAMFLYQNGREFELVDKRGQSDNGVDIIVNGGTINVKTSKGEPLPYYSLIIRADVLHSSDYFIQCYIPEGEDVCIYIGMEMHSQVITDRYLKEFVSSKHNTKFPAYMKNINYLTMKPLDLLIRPYSLPLHQEEVNRFISLT